MLIVFALIALAIGIVESDQTMFVVANVYVAAALVVQRVR